MLIWCDSDIFVLLEGPKTEKSPSKMDFQGREDHVRVLPHDRPMPTRCPPNVPFKLPTGRASHPSEDSDKDPAHLTKPTTPPKPDLSMYATHHTALYSVHVELPHTHEYQGCLWEFTGELLDTTLFT